MIVRVAGLDPAKKHRGYKVNGYVKAVLQARALEQALAWAKEEVKRKLQGLNGGELAWAAQCISETITLGASTAIAKRDKVLMRGQGPTPLEDRAGQGEVR
jgi:hypothetical protein